MATFAALLAALIAVAGMFLVAVPVQCAANVWEVQPPPTNCLPAQRPATVAWYLLWTLVQGLILAVPLAALTAVAGALVRRRRPAPESVTGESVTGESVTGESVTGDGAGDDVPPVPRSRRVLTAVVLVLLAAVLVGLALAILPSAGGEWLTP